MLTTISATMIPNRKKPALFIYTATTRFGKDFSSFRIVEDRKLFFNLPNGYLEERQRERGLKTIVKYTQDSVRFQVKDYARENFGPFWWIACLFIKF